MSEILGIYVHIPFCRRKCNYCSFYSVTVLDSVDQYLDALILQWDGLKKELNNKQQYTLYIGGGTPSLLDSYQFEKLMSAFQGIEFLELTLEANPESITEEKLELWSKQGINRLSIGVQSFDDNILKYLGRLHDGDQAIISIERAKCYFSNINMDLIFGVPGQTLESIKKDINFIKELSPEHVSYYGLSIEPGTVLYDKNVKADDDLQYEMFIYIHQELTKLGYIHYEISNFAKDSKQSIHNLNYWRCGEYIGIGPGAVGFDGKQRYKWVEDVNEYILKPRIIEKENFEEFEKIMLGLRINEGLDLAYFDNFEDGLKHAKKYGLIEIKENKVFPTIEGFVKNNELCSLFLT